MARLARPPGPQINVVLAVIGQMFPERFPFDPLAFGVSIAREFGDIAHYQVGPLHVYQLSHPDFARQILVEEPEKFYKPRLIKQAFGAFAGQGLLTSDGAIWKQQRKLIQPAFHHAQLVTYGAVMVGHALRMIDSLEDGAVVEIHEVMPRLTLAIVVQTLFGADVTREATDVGRLMVAVLDAANDRLNRILRVPSWVPTRRNLREKRALARLDEMLDSFIAAHRASGEKPADLLSMLLAATDEDSGIRMSDGQLHEEMMTLFMAGHETTAMALTWTWYLLSQHPEVEERLVREVSRVLGGRAPTVADLPQLPYTDMVVREAMRLYPPAAGFAREPIEDVHIGGYNVPKGSLVTVNTYALHHDLRFFDEPERFNPERFSAGWEERIPRYAFLPFGGGPRVCIGNGFCDDGGSVDIGDSGATLPAIARARSGNRADATGHRASQARDQDEDGRARKRESLITQGHGVVAAHDRSVYVVAVVSCGPQLLRSGRSSRYELIGRSPEPSTCGRRPHTIGRSWRKPLRICFGRSSL